MNTSYGPGVMIEDDTRPCDLRTDPGQERPLDDAETEARLTRLMAELMAENDGPPEAFARLRIEAMPA